jgi:hypothetical protein
MSVADKPEDNWVDILDPKMLDRFQGFFTDHDITEENHDELLGAFEKQSVDEALKNGYEKEAAEKWVSRQIAIILKIVSDSNDVIKKHGLEGHFAKSSVSGDGLAAFQDMRAPVLPIEDSEIFRELVWAMQDRTIHYDMDNCKEYQAWRDTMSVADFAPIAHRFLVRKPTLHSFPYPI